MGKSRYTLRVDEDDLEDWNQAVEDSDSEYTSLRHLIELSVTRELSDNYVLRDDIEGLEVGVGSSVESGIEELRNEVAELREDIESLEVTQSHDPEQVADLAAVLHSMIPVVKRENLNDWLKTSIRNTPQISPEEVVQSYGRVQDIVDYMDESGSVIRKAIGKLEYDMDDVHTGMDADGARRVYKVVDELPDDG